MTYLLAFDAGEFCLMKVNSEDFCTYSTHWTSSPPKPLDLVYHDHSEDDTVTDWAYDNNITNWLFDTLQEYDEFIQTNPELFI